LGKLTGGLSLEGLEKYLEAVLKKHRGNQSESGRKLKSLELEC